MAFIIYTLEVSAKIFAHVGTVIFIARESSTNSPLIFMIKLDIKYFDYLLLLFERNININK